MTSSPSPTGTSDFPPKVEAYIVRKGKKLAVVDGGGKPLKSILVHYDGEIEWQCDLGPWEVLRKMDGKNPFKNGNGVKGGKGEKKKTPVSGKSPHVVVCGYSVAVWDENKKELLLMDPEIVVGPPGLD